MTTHPLFFEAAGETLFGTCTEPDQPGSLGVTVLRGGGYTAAVTRSPLWTPLETRLASVGVRTLRFDYHGAGDSTGLIGEMGSNRYFAADVVGAVDSLRSRGVSRHVLIGQCFGARNALAAADRIEDLAGLVLIAPLVRDFDRGEGTATRLAEGSTLEFMSRGVGALEPTMLLKPKQLARIAGAARILARTKARAALARIRPGDGTPPWVSRPFLDALTGAIERGVPVLFVFGTEDGWEDFQAALPGRLEALVERAGPAMQIEVLDGKVHGRAALPTQEALGDLIWEWMTASFGLGSG